MMRHLRPGGRCRSGLCSSATSALRCYKVRLGSFSLCEPQLGWSVVRTFEQLPR